MSAIQIGFLVASFLVGLYIGAAITSKERDILKSDIASSLDEIARLERELSNARLTNQNLTRSGYVRANGFKS